MKLEDKMMYRNVFGNYEEVIVKKINKETVRVLASRFRMLSVSKDKLISIAEYEKLSA